MVPRRHPMPHSFAAELNRFGPGAPPAPVPSPVEARAYCRQLARRHYENFTVAGLFVPRRLRQHLSNVYAYCRWADDLADETADPQQSLRLLDWWESQLDACYRGRAVHPVFVALGSTIEEFAIPRDPFADLLVAFRQDQQVTRYETFEQVLGYCRYSADPVGRLVLHLGRCRDPQRARLADAVCTGLQLANFCQDVARDWDRGRVYLPRETLRRFGCDESVFKRRGTTEEFRLVLAVEVDRAEAWLRRGLPLVPRMPRGLRLAVALFAHGGLAVLRAVRRQDYDVWSRRPVVTGAEKLRLAARCGWNLLVGRPTGNLQ